MAGDLGIISSNKEAKELNIVNFNGTGTKILSNAGTKYLQYNNPEYFNFAMTKKKDVFAFASGSGRLQIYSIVGNVNKEIEYVNVDHDTER